MSESVCRAWNVRRRSTWILAGVCLLCASCATTFVLRPKRHAPQSWDSERGPVIPHDTFPADCSLCHLGGAWHRIREDFRFDHAQETGVALRGGHRTAQCLRCHNDRGPVEVFSRQGCAGCHDDEHRGQLGKECWQCHTEDNWIAHGQIAQHNRTRFPLTGAHTAAACWRCHPGAQQGRFTHAPVQCAACHFEDLARATAPDHRALGWMHDCQNCHRPTDWVGEEFVHSKFSLTGAHRAVACQTCHANQNVAGLSSACVSCHIGDYQAATDPNHVAVGLPTTCQSCHNTNSWQGASFNHAGVTVQCSVCHMTQYNAAEDPNHVTSGLPTTCENCHTPAAWSGASFNHPGITGNCASCHQTDYNRTSEPNHVSAGYPTACEMCHTMASWKPVNFNHAGVSGDCSSCHLADYNRTSSPNHSAAAYPTTCQNCHSTASWRVATFNHAGVSGNCASCHLIDYNQATNPSHASAGFPTTCQPCHNTTAWQDANFNHEFRITSGAHRSYSCQECHRTPSNFSLVSCTHCHNHSQSSMSSKHSEFGGYSWSNAACIGCHPTG